MPPRRPFRDRIPGLPRTEPLPSLYDRHPYAATALRRARGVRVVPLDRIVGTVRHPTQNSSDFRPLPSLRGRNWQGRWQRIQRATQQLAILPAVELLKVGDEYYVVDGHNRVAAALQNGAVAIDADVTELQLPGQPAVAERGEHNDAATLLTGSRELRSAARGERPATGVPSAVERLRREELLRPAETPDSEPEADA